MANKSTSVRDINLVNTIFATTFLQKKTRKSVMIWPLASNNFLKAKETADCPATADILSFTTGKDYCRHVHDGGWRQ